MTIRVPLEFMTEKDLKSDPWVEGQTRDYKFTVFDRVSVLICLFRLVLCIYLRLESTSVLPLPLQPTKDFLQTYSPQASLFLSEHDVYHITYSQHRKEMDYAVIKAKESMNSIHSVI